MLGASMAIRIFKPPVNSLEEVLESPMSFAVANGTSVYGLFSKAAPGTIENKIFETKINVTGVTLPKSDKFGLAEMLAGAVFFPNLTALYAFYSFLFTIYCSLLYSLSALYHILSQLSLFNLF